VCVVLTRTQHNTQQQSVVAAATAATRAAAARAQEATEAANEAYCARPRQRTLNVASYDGWQRGVRVDGRRLFNANYMAYTRAWMDTERLGSSLVDTTLRNHTR
jgi:hypothetical protein